MQESKAGVEEYCEGGEVKDDAFIKMERGIVAWFDRICQKWEVKGKTVRQADLRGRIMAGLGFVNIKIPITHPSQIHSWLDESDLKEEIWDGV